MSNFAFYLSKLKYFSAVKKGSSFICILPIFIGFFPIRFLKAISVTKAKRIFCLMLRKEIGANNGIVKLRRCHVIRKQSFFQPYPLSSIFKQIIVNFSRNEIGVLATCHSHKGHKLKPCTKLC